MDGGYKKKLKTINSVLYKVSLSVVVIYFLFIKDADLSWSPVFFFAGAVLGVSIIVTEILIRRKR